MNIALVVYSMTGNTLSLAQEVKKALERKGHEAQVMEIKIENEDGAVKGQPVKLSERPDIAGFDGAVFLSPVWAFSLCSVMREYVKEMRQMGVRPAAVLTTQQLPFAWMGGNRARKQLEALLRGKGMSVVHKGGVYWTKKDREEQIARLARETANAF